jgi:hypothetical protein
MISRQNELPGIQYVRASIVVIQKTEKGGVGILRQQLKLKMLLVLVLKT